MILLQGHPGRGGLLGVGGEQGGPCRVCVEPGPPEGQRARSHRTRVYGCEVAMQGHSGEAVLFKI